MFLQRGSSSDSNPIPTLRKDSLLEKSIGGRFDRALARHVGFEPCNFLFEKGNALGELGCG